MKVSMLTSIEEFHSLKQDWNELLSQSESHGIFLKWEWLYNWWLVYGGGSKELCLVVVKENERLAGIAPFYLRRGSLFLPNELRFLGSNVVCTDYLDFVLLKGREKELVGAIFSFLTSRLDLWDRISLTDLPSRSGSFSWANFGFGSRKIKLKSPSSTCPYIDLTLSWEKIFDSYSSILKNIIKRKVKQFEVEHKGQLIEVDSDNEIDFYFSEFVRLQKLRMVQKKIVSPFLDPKFLRFHHEIIKQVYKAGNVKLMFLKVKAQLIAGIYLLVDSNKFYYYQSGFDPEWDHLSPGTLLFHYVIKNAKEKGIAEFDFLQGDGPYKSYWTKSKKTNIKITVYNQSIKSRLSSFIDETKEKLKPISRLIRKVS